MVIEVDKVKLWDFRNCDKDFIFFFVLSVMEIYGKVWNRGAICFYVYFKRFVYWIGVVGE